MVSGMHDTSHEYTFDGIYAGTLVTTLYPSAAWNLFDTWWAVFGLQLHTITILKAHVASYSARLLQWGQSVFDVLSFSRIFRKNLECGCQKPFQKFPDFSLFCEGWCVGLHDTHLLFSQS
jgi:hypothetical protein